MGGQFIALWSVGIGVAGLTITVLGIVLRATIRITRAWSRLESDVRVVIRDFELHMANERAERAEIIARHVGDVNGLDARLSLVERELVRLGGMAGHAGTA